MNIPTGGMSAVVNGLKYNTATATPIANDCYWDGSNFERDGRNTYLYKTPKGRYFFVHLTQWQGESGTIVPCTEEDAKEFAEERLDAEDFEDAFGEVEAA